MKNKQSQDFAIGKPDTFDFRGLSKFGMNGQCSSQSTFGRLIDNDVIGH